MGDHRHPVEIRLSPPRKKNPTLGVRGGDLDRGPPRRGSEKWAWGLGGRSPPPDLASQSSGLNAASVPSAPVDAAYPNLGLASPVRQIRDDVCATHVFPRPDFAILCNISPQVRRAIVAAGRKHRPSSRRRISKPDNWRVQPRIVQLMHMGQKISQRTRERSYIDHHATRCRTMRSGKQTFGEHRPACTAGSQASSGTLCLSTNMLETVSCDGAHNTSGDSSRALYSGHASKASPARMAWQLQRKGSCDRPPSQIRSHKRVA